MLPNFKKSYEVDREGDGHLPPNIWFRAPENPPPGSRSVFAGGFPAFAASLDTTCPRPVAIGRGSG